MDSEIRIYRHSIGKYYSVGLKLDVERLLVVHRRPRRAVTTFLILKGPHLYYYLGYFAFIQWKVLQVDVEVHLRWLTKWSFEAAIHILFGWLCLEDLMRLKYSPISTLWGGLLTSLNWLSHLATRKYSASL